MSAQDKKFSNKDELANWLKLLRVDEDDAIEAADKLFAGGFNKPSRLLGITVEELKNDVGIQNPLARELSNKLKDQQSQENISLPQSRVSKTLLAQIWQSVLRVENTESDELATALVFDVYKDDAGLYMLLLLNKHFEFKKDEVVRALQYNASNECFFVESFTKKELSVFAQGDDSREEDFIIYRLALNQAEWELTEPGWVRRVVAKPASKKMRAAATAAQLKKTEIVCKTPRYSYQIEISMPVHIFGFPHTAAGRWEGLSNVTSIGRSTFGLQMLSAPGLSGGAVVATEQGEVVGIMGGNHDAEEDGKPQPFNAYAIDARSFPQRPSSQPSSPDSQERTEEDSVHLRTL